MKVLKSYKYRLYPTKEQAKMLDFLLWQGRKIYNTALALKIRMWQVHGDSLSVYDLRDQICYVRNQYPDTWGMLPRNTVDDLVRRLDKAYKAFFRRVKNGDEKAGFPRFKGRYHFYSLGYPNGWKLKKDECRLYLMNVGDINLNYHRPLPEDCKIKIAVIKRTKTNKWFVVFQLETNIEIERSTKPAVGIDMGLKSLLALSDGQLVENPRWYREAMKKLRVKQRSLARKKKGGKNRAKARHELAVLHEKINNQREWFWHNVTDWLTKEYGFIALEDLTLDFMLKNKHLAMSSHDAGLGMFRQMLEYKAKERGVIVVYAPPAYTTQTCSQCGDVKKKELSERVHNCVECGLELDRDVNAARNILRLGIKQAEHVCHGVTQSNRANVP